jgi:deoxyinosine 3'endonuclease (endonuclease V)
MKIPYVPSFLAFREAPHLLRLIEKLKISGKEYQPQLIMFDGNGILHTKGCGLASHMGVLLDLPTIGASKTSFYVDGLTKDRVRKLCEESFEK